MQHLALCLREAGCEDVDRVLDDVPEQRNLDLEVLGMTLRGSSNSDVVSRRSLGVRGSHDIAV